MPSPYAQIGPIVFGVVVLFFVLRQLAARRVRAWTLVVLPLAPLAGAFAQSRAGLVVTPTEVGVAAAGLVCAVGLGLARGMVARVWRDVDGALWTAGSSTLLALWGVSIAVRLGLATLSASFGGDGNTLQVESMALAAATLAAQNAALWLRARPGAMPVAAAVR